jgi:hypothetical protein
VLSVANRTASVSLSASTQPSAPFLNVTQYAGIQASERRLSLEIRPFGARAIKRQRFAQRCDLGLDSVDFGVVDASDAVMCYLGFTLGNFR